MRTFLVPLVALVPILPLQAQSASWPQFRGQKGNGLAVGEQKLPTEIGPDKNVLWKVALPPGHSSPIVFGDRIYLTAVRDKKQLLTMALDRATGKVLWEVEAPYKELERIHAIGSYAQGTPATDGERIVSFFGSCGLFCYDTAGKLLWYLPLGPFKNYLGAGSSPIIVGDGVILNQDHDLDSFLIAVDKRTGKPLWRVNRSEFPVGYATPVLWEANGKQQIVINGTLRVVGYDVETGQEVWTIHGMARAVHMTPTVGPDGTLYAAGWTGGGDDNDRFDVPTFDQMLRERDKNKNGTLEEDELPEGPIKQRFNLIDRDKDGHITRAEYDYMKRIFDTALNRIIAVKPGGVGDISTTHVLWSQRKHLPVVPSPLIYRDHIFCIKNGGFLATLDSRTGKLVKAERVPGSADYYASPVGGDGKVYLLSQKGHVIVVSAEGEWKVLHRDRFDDDVYATPAIVDGKIYLRTAGYLYCFGTKQ
jgi:outer membrane protein assembly factor BamB